MYPDVIFFFHIFSVNFKKTFKKFLVTTLKYFPISSTFRFKEMSRAIKIVH